MSKRSPLHPQRSQRPQVIGWAEWISLPDLGIQRLKAKIDSGARTCALHVTRLRKVDKDAQGRQVLEIQIPTGREGRGVTVTARAVVLERVQVRDSGGHAERRPVIETTLGLGSRKRRVRVTLTDRGDMLFPMLVGRTGVPPGLLVDVDAQYLFGKPKR